MQNECRRYQILVAPCQADLSVDGFDYHGGLAASTAEARPASISRCSGLDPATSAGNKTDSSGVLYL